MKPQNAVLSWVAAILLLAGALFMLPHGKLHDFGTVPWFLAGAAIMLVGFFGALRFPPQSAALFWAVAGAVRLILLFQTPGDDIYRYVWEGRMLAAGWNPYLHAPDAATLESFRDTLWSSVQHRSFTAIYPPLAQWMMASLAAVWAAPIFFTLVFTLADLAVIGLLVRKFALTPALIYAWNPLVIYSFAGGGHYDSVFILAMVLGWLAWDHGKPTRAAGWLGVAVALKWMALPLLAWVIWQVFQRGWERRQWRSVAQAAGLAFAPLLLSYLALSLWTKEWTLQLYPADFSRFARSAELIPGMVGWFWEQSRFHNQWFALPLAVGWSVLILRGKELAPTAEWMFFLALVLTPMLHAWYFTWMIPFAVQTRNRGTLAVSASAFVYFLLYHHIEAPGGAWRLQPWETALLWLPLVVGFLFSSWQRQRRSLESTS